MPLVACPSCGYGISDAAPTCPYCGHPMNQSGLRAGRLNPVHTGQVVAIERTGKGLKAQGCLATIALLAGVVLLLIAIVGSQDNRTSNHKADYSTVITVGAVLLAVSIPWMIYVKLATWWRHH